MIFNSIEFFVFLPVAFLLYWFIRNIKLQNLFIVIASYLFYGWWDWRFLSLIIFSTLVDFTIGSLLKKEQVTQKRKLYLLISVIINLGFLGFFKYYNFFVDSFIDAFSFFGKELSVNSLNIILPVGISFYTFQTLSYTIDVYRKKLEPTKDFLAFSAFVCFFPQLVAGPIERASNLLPQFYSKRKFKYKQAVEGLKLILWGLFKKIVIADSLAPIVDDVFINYDTYASSTLIMGAVFFAFQIYGDFSGYSDIAIGTSKLFGFELMSNFKFPYFSKNVSEFWQRWHISLSTWFRDYVYIPLGGSHGSKFKTIRNILIVFLISGFWHGANWTFIIWGAFHAVLFLPIYFLKNRSNRIKFLAPFSIVFNFAVICVGWVFFRSDSISIANIYLQRMFFNFSYEYYLHPRGFRMIDYFILLAVFLVYEYIIKDNERNPFPIKNKVFRYITYILVIFSMLLFFDDGVDRSFIYFQF